MSFTYCFLDFLPKVPRELLDNYFNYSSGQQLIKIDERIRTFNDGTTTIESDYERYEITGKLRTWLEFNIVRNPIDFGAAVNNINSSVCDGPIHLDYTRDYTLLYVITPGGDQVKTRFFQEPGYPLVREDINVHVPPVDLTSYLLSKTFEEVDSVIIPHDRWCLLNVKTVHQVVGLTGPRNTIQISLGKDNKFVNNI